MVGLCATDAISVAPVMPGADMKADAGMVRNVRVEWTRHRPSSCGSGLRHSTPHRAYSFANKRSSDEGTCARWNRPLADPINWTSSSQRIGRLRGTACASGFLSIDTLEGSTHRWKCSLLFPQKLWRRPIPTDWVLLPETKATFRP